VIFDRDTPNGTIIYEKNQTNCLMLKETQQQAVDLEEQYVKGEFMFNIDVNNADACTPID
jgi:hypothetical protein